MRGSDVPEATSGQIAWPGDGDPAGAFTPQVNGGRVPTSAGACLPAQLPSNAVQAPVLLFAGSAVPGHTSPDGRRGRGHRKGSDHDLIQGHTAMASVLSLGLSHFSGPRDCDGRADWWCGTVGRPDGAGTRVRWWVDKPVSRPSRGGQIPPVSWRREADLELGVDGLRIRPAGSLGRIL